MRPNRYEYRFEWHIATKNYEITQMLDARGAAGWRVASSYGYKAADNAGIQQHYVAFTFERPLKNKLKKILP